MAFSSLHACKKWCTVLGSFLLMCPAGIPWYWGNISVYTTSYFLKHFPASSAVESPWVVPLVVIGGCIGVLTSGALNIFFGKRPTVICGIVMVNSGWFVVYFVFQKSLLCTSIVIGLVISTGAFIQEGIVLLYSLYWFQNKNMGRVSAFVQSGNTVGAICVNQFVTFYLNPHNLLPDKIVGPFKIFSQDEIVDKVPHMFLILASMSSAVDLLGLVMISDNAESNTEECQYLKTIHGDSIEPHGQGSTSMNRDPTVATESQETEDSNSSPSTSTTTDPIDLSPKQVIRSSTLYYYWLFFVVMEMSYITMTNYYKSYGQIHIGDDHFLTNVSTALLIGISVSRNVWGVILDRYGLKISLIIAFAGSGVISPWLYFSPLVNKWCYVLNTVIFGYFSSPLFTLFTYAAVKSFGKTYFIFNFGLIMVPTVVTNVALPPLLECVLVDLGWFYVFAFCSICNLIGLLILILFFRDNVY